MDGTLPVPIQDFANQIRPVSGAARTSKRRGKAGCTGLLQPPLYLQPVIAWAKPSAALHGLETTNLVFD